MDDTEHTEYCAAGFYYEKTKKHGDGGNKMRIIEKEAKTKEEAIDLVLKEIGIENKDLITDMEIIENSKSRFFMFNNKKINVRATVLEPLERSVQSFLKELLEKMNINMNMIKVTDNNEALSLELDVDNVALVIGRRGKTLEAIQYITNLIFNRNKETKTKIILDIKKYREKRIQALQKLAQNSALVVKRTRRDRVLNPMNPYERKIIHSALQNDKDVTTESIGEGVYKQIKITMRRTNEKF